MTVTAYRVIDGQISFENYTYHNVKRLEQTPQGFVRIVTDRFETALDLKYNHLEVSFADFQREEDVHD